MALGIIMMIIEGLCTAPPSRERILVAYSSAIVSPLSVSVTVLSPSSSGDVIVALDCVVSAEVYMDTV